LQIRVNHLRLREARIVGTWLRYCDGDLHSQLVDLKAGLESDETCSWSIDTHLKYLITRLIDQKFKSECIKSLMLNTKFHMELDRLGLSVSAGMISLPGGSWVPTEHMSLPTNCPTSCNRVLTWSLLEHAKGGGRSWTKKI
jgi:hypothetical protein